MEFVPGPDLRVDDEHLGLGENYRPKHLSPSSANLYQQCPRKWRHRYVDRLPDPPGQPALVGTFAHLVLEHLLQLPPGKRSQDQAKEIARAQWPEFETEEDYQALDLDGDESRAFRWLAWQAVAGLWALETPDEVDVHATELEVMVDLNNVPFRGIVDRIDIIRDEYVVSDYKSGKAPADRFRDRPLKQVLLYAAALEQLLGERPLGARLLYLGQRTLGVRVTEENLAQSVDQLSTTWQSLNADCESREFAADVGPLCAWCPFLAACAEGQAEVLRRDQAGSVRADAPGLQIVYAQAG